MDLLEAWFKQQGWQPWPFQRQAWQAFADGDEGLIHVPTGAGKTYTAAAAAIAALGKLGDGEASGLRVVYVTPLKALARDIELALNHLTQGLGLALAVESRTGDTANRIRARQAKRLPHVLVTTPESLALLCARSDAPEAMSRITAVIVDEWHELVSSKRGVLLQLTLSRLRAHSPQLRTWGLSATLRDPGAAARALVPVSREPVVIRGDMARPVHLSSLLPDAVEAFAWVGHMGLSMVGKVAAKIDPAVSTLIFTNTRAQAEKWYQALAMLMPEWEDILALHHGSLANDNREAIELGLKSGAVRIVVATSSLDLGVDFPAVEAVFQIGSPKGVARLIQRAGRSAHRPNAPCQIVCVPTHSLELLEFSAARRALAANNVEAHEAALGSCDVLAQHLVSCALGGGFTKAELWREVRGTDAFKSFSEATFGWCLLFVENGGNVLDAYPAYHRLVVDQGRYTIADRRQAQLHRMNLGTIVADEQAEVKLQRGRRLGLVDESFLSRLKPKDRFVIGGRTVELIKLHGLTAYVCIAAGKSAMVPAWQGTLMPLSLPLCQELQQILGEQAQGEPAREPETAAAAPLLKAQRQLSHLPQADELLLETWTSKAGTSLFVHSFAGRQVHEALASLLALRLSRLVKATFAVTANDYGLSLTSTAALDFRALLRPELFSSDNLAADLEETIDLGQAAKRRFREIARIAGLVRQSYPGQRKGGRAVHVSASLLYDTLARFDPGHPLVQQALDEARQGLESRGRLEATMAWCTQAAWMWIELRRPSPLAFGLVVEQVRARLGSESLAERVQAMQAAWIRADERTTDARPKDQSRRRRAAAPPRAARLLAKNSDADRSGPALG